MFHKEMARLGISLSFGTTLEKKKITFLIFMGENLNYIMDNKQVLFK